MVENCPECNTEISPEATVCWKCGANITRKKIEHEEKSLDELFARLEEKTYGRKDEVTDVVDVKKVTEKVEKVQTNGLKVTSPKNRGLQPSGRINGLTNGLTNGAEFTRRYQKLHYVQREKRILNFKILVIPVILIILVSISLITIFLSVGLREPIVIDGTFNDWSEIKKFQQKELTGSSVNMRIQQFALLESSKAFFVYLKVNGIILNGNAPSSTDNKLADEIRIFFDMDNNPSTGYRIKQLGADYLVQVYGWNNEVYSSSAQKFEDSNLYNWSGFKTISSVSAQSKGSEIELRIPKWSLENRQSPIIIIQTRDYNGNVDFTNFAISVNKSAIYAEINYNQLEILPVDTENQILNISVEALNSEVKLQKIILRNTGDAIFSNLKLTTPRGLYNVNNNEITLDYLLPENSKTVFQLSGTLNSSESGRVVGIAIDKIICDTNALTIRTSGLLKSYVGKIPLGILIDGAFADWNNVPKDFNTTAEPNNKNIDISNFAINRENRNANFYIHVEGKMLGGVEVPVAGQIKIVEIPTGNYTPPPLITGEDYLRVYMNINNATSGYIVKPFNFIANYLIQITGLGAEITSKKYLKYIGNGNSWEWLDEMDVPAGVDEKRIEFQTVVNGDFKALIETSDWAKRERDSTDIHPTVSKKEENPNGKNDYPAEEKNINNNLIFSAAVESIYLGNLEEKWKNSEKYVENGDITPYDFPFGTNIRVGSGISVRDDTRPSITSDSAGTLYMVYQRKWSDTDDDIWFAKSTDGGLTWNTYGLNDSTNNERTPVIIANAANNITVFFDSGSYFQYLTSSDGGTTWTEWVIPSWTDYSKLHNISAAYYQTNYIYITGEYENSPTNYDIHFIRTVDGGSTWEWYIIAYSPTLNERYPSIGISSTPRVGIAYNNYTTASNSDLYYAYDTNLDNTWAWPIIIVNSNKFEGYPSIAASTTNFYVAYQYDYWGNESDWDIRLAYSSDGGASWEATSRIINQSTSHERYPVISASGTNVYAAYFYNGIHINYKTSTDAGSTWNPPNKVNDNTGTAVEGFRNVAIVYNGQPRIAWSDSRDSAIYGYEIYYATIPEISNSVFPITNLLLSFIIAVPLYRIRRNLNLK